MSNTVQLGKILYTDYILLFQAAGLVLLVAMIGAIVLTLRDRTSSRHQSIAAQVNRMPENTLELVDMKSGAGTKATGFLRPKAREPEPVAESHDSHGGHH